MKTFKDIRIGNNFYFIGCLGKSRWLKTSETMALCVDTKPIETSNGNGRYELNQNKKFVPDQIVDEL